MELNCGLCRSLQDEGAGGVELWFVQDRDAGGVVLGSLQDEGAGGVELWFEQDGRAGGVEL